VLLATDIDFGVKHSSDFGSIKPDGGHNQEMTSYFNQRVLRDILGGVVLPWAHSGELLITVAEPGWPIPEGVIVTPQKNALLAPTGVQLQSQRNIPWMAMGLHCRPHPLMLFILEGEADLRIGRTLGTACDQTHKGRTAQQYEVSLYSLPARSCFIVPPDIAHSDGSMPHWERPFPESAHSQILWLQILPTGAIVHVCQTDGLTHSHNSSLFIRDLQIPILMRFFLERVNQSPENSTLLTSFLSTLLLCFDNSQLTNLMQDDDRPEISDELSRGRGVVQHGGNLQSEIFDRACLYISSHLSDSLSPVQIARQAHVSVAQLNRIFHARHGIPVMKYVTGRRLEEAKNLLLRTSLTTLEIGEICGYPHRTHFSRAFKEHLGTAPHAFRRQAVRRSEEEL
jgi:AraC-like DNA-binding protein